MNSILQTVFGLLGGLALFLFGMNMMSEGLQKAAGERMKSILGMLTKNPVLGVLAGTVVTAVLQSSSATTVMVIGFASAGLMNLPQAISVILGANIGTTMTAQLLAFNINDYIYPIVFIGFFLSFLSKNEKRKNIGQTIFAFGVLFIGIETMGDVMEPLASSTVFTNLFQKVSEIPVLGVVTGVVMTLVVQSSSATIAVLQNFAAQAGPDGIHSVLGLEGAIPILLGDNIGTTITALLACVGQSKNAKRTAVAHSVFNISGSFVFLWIIPWFAKFVEWISPKGNELDVISRQIANAHTIFNIVCTLIWLPLIAVLVKIVMFLVPGEDGKEVALAGSKYLDYKLINQPVFAIRMVTLELNDVCLHVKQIVRKLKKSLDSNNLNALLQIRTICEKAEQRGEEVMQYMAALFANGSLTEEQTVYVSDMMLVVENAQHIQRRCGEMEAYLEKMMEKGYQYSSDALKDLQKNLEQVEKVYHKTLTYLQMGGENPLAGLEEQRNKMIKQRNKASKNNLKRMKEKRCHKENGVLFNRMLFSMERINHDCLNLLENNISQFRLEEESNE